jgi:DNA replication protein DnaC
MDHPQFGKSVPCMCTIRANIEKQALSPSFDERAWKQIMAGLKLHGHVNELTEVEHKMTNMKRNRLQKLSGLTDAERAVKLDDIVAESGSGTARMVTAARNFVARPAGFLTVYGSTGNAKTAVMHGIVNELVNQSVEAVYVTAYDVIGWIRAAFDKQHEVVDDTAHDRLKQLERVRVLCLDELDKIKWSDWVEEQITDLIDARYRLGLDWEVGTVVAMNAAPSTLPPWIYSRLRDGRNVMIENKDADVRPGMEN